MYVSHNILAGLCDSYTFSASLTAWCHFAQK